MIVTRIFLPDGTPINKIAVVNPDGTNISGGGGGGGGAVTVADGANVVEGATTDAVVAAGAAGTFSAKLRRLTTDISAQLARMASLGAGTISTSAPINVATDDVILGPTNETAPASDTAASGLNGRLQRIAQRLTTMLTGIVLAAGENMIGKVVGIITNPTASVTRPNDTNAYAVGDLVANSVTAGSVTSPSWATATRVAAGNARILKTRLSKTGTGVSGAAFRVHFFSVSPLPPTNGDNGVFVPAGAANHLGYMDIFSMIQCTDGAVGESPVGSDISFALGSGQTIYALLEARGAYTPIANEVFTITPEIAQN
jgi:hypothetical protein